MKESTLQAVSDLIDRYPALDACRGDLENAVRVLCKSFAGGHKLLTCGNGGSAADAEHIVGELMKGFLLPRRLTGDIAASIRETAPENADYLLENLQGTLPAVSLVAETALTTAFANDQAADLGFAQQVLGLGSEGDVLLAISTSGNSKNVVYALQVARAKRVTSIALTGKSGGRIVREHLADIAIRVPDDETFRIQELHLPVYHMLCIAVENEFFGA